MQDPCTCSLYLCTMYLSCNMVNYFKKPGRNIEMLENMRKQAQELNISEAGCCGYITFDEMSVQASV